MVRTLLLIFIFSFAYPVFGQQEEDKILFSEALSLHLPKYETKAKKAYYYRNYEEAQHLFDSLVEFGLNGSYMNNFKFRQVNGKKISLHDYKKPVYFITYASWCVQSKGEIPAINKLANKYHDQIDFVILFWDSKRTTKKMSKKYNDNIHIVYVDEQENQDAFVIKQLKHSLGLPTTFLMDKDKVIQDIRRGVSHAYGKDKDDSYDQNYNSIYDGIANHLLGDREYGSDSSPVALNN